MKELIQQLYNCTVVQWDEWEDDMVVFSVFQNGTLIVADSLELLILALGPVERRLAA